MIYLGHFSDQGLMFTPHASAWGKPRCIAFNAGEGTAEDNVGIFPSFSAGSLIMTEPNLKNRHLSVHFEVPRIEGNRDPRGIPALLSFRITNTSENAW